MTDFLYMGMVGMDYMCMMHMDYIGMVGMCYMVIVGMGYIDMVSMSYLSVNSHRVDGALWARQLPPIGDVDEEVVLIVFPLQDTKEVVWRDLLLLALL